MSKNALPRDMNCLEIAASKAYGYSEERQNESPNCTRGSSPVTSAIRPSCIWSDVGDANGSSLEHNHSVETLREPQRVSEIFEVHMSEQDFITRQDSASVTLRPDDALVNYEAHPDIDLDYPIDPLLEAQPLACEEALQSQTPKSEAPCNQANEFEDCHDLTGTALTDTEVYASALHNNTKGMRRLGRAIATSRSGHAVHKRNMATRSRCESELLCHQSSPPSPSPPDKSTPPASNVSTLCMSSHQAPHNTEPDERPSATTVEDSLRSSLVSKRVIVEGVGVFRLEFERSLCAKHRQRGIVEHYSRGSTKITKPRYQKTQNRSVGGKFTDDQDALLLKLRRHKKLSWSETYRQFSLKFPGRSRGSLQVHYSTKLKARE